MQLPLPCITACTFDHYVFTAFLIFTLYARARSLKVFFISHESLPEHSEQAGEIKVTVKSTGSTVIAVYMSTCYSGFELHGPPPPADENND